VGERPAVPQDVAEGLDYAATKVGSAFASVEGDEVLAVAVEVRGCCNFLEVGVCHPASAARAAAVLSGDMAGAAAHHVLVLG